MVRTFEARGKSWFTKFAHTKDTFILSCTCEPFSGISSGYYPPIEKNEYSDAFEKERSGEEVRTGGGWRMNARGGGHASPPPLSSPPHPASEGLEAHYSTQLGNSRFWGHPNFSGCGTLSLGGPHLFTHFEVTKKQSYIRKFGSFEHFSCKILSSEWMRWFFFSSDDLL